MLCQNKISCFDYYVFIMISHWMPKTNISHCQWCHLLNSVVGQNGLLSLLLAKLQVPKPNGITMRCSVNLSSYAFHHRWNHTISCQGNSKSPKLPSLCSLRSMHLILLTRTFQVSGFLFKNGYIILFFLFLILLFICLTITILDITILDMMGALEWLHINFSYWPHTRVLRKLLNRSADFKPVTLPVSEHVNHCWAAKNSMPKANVIRIFRLM